MPRFKNVCVLGLGVIGLPTARHISRYYDVFGYDINPDKVKAASHHFPATADWSRIPISDVFVVCVNTWWRDGKADMSAVEAVCRRIFEIAEPDSLVSIESTVAVGTSRRIFKDIFQERVHVANCPHRLWELGTLSPKDMQEYGVNQIRILGAVNEESASVAKTYFDSIQIETRAVSSSEISEMSKIAENSYRYIEIAYAEELAMVCKKQGLSFEEVRNACNTLKREKEKWQVQIMEARNGIGGSCLPKDIEYLYAITNPAKLIKGAMETDKFFRELLSRGKQ